MDLHNIMCNKVVIGISLFGIQFVGKHSEVECVYIPTASITKKHNVMNSITNLHVQIHVQVLLYETLSRIA